MSQQTYFAENSAFEMERERLSMLERVFDGVTRDGLMRLGVGEGWRCCEIGAGGGSLTRWLANVVAPEGKVVAVDLDTRFLEGFQQANVEVIEADFLSDVRIGDSFDLVFTRFVLMHLSDPKRAVHRMAQLVKPRGWVFAIDCDLCLYSAADPDHPDAGRFEQILQKLATDDRERHGINYRMGRSLPKLFEASGLVDVSNSAWTSVFRGGSLQADLWRRTWEVTLPKVMSDGVLSREEMDLFLSTMTDPTFQFLDALFFQVSGRRPPV